MNSEDSHSSQVHTQKGISSPGPRHPNFRSVFTCTVKLMNEIDPVSQVILTRLNNPLIPEGEEALSVFNDSKRCVKFRFKPNSDYGFLFITNSDNKFIDAIKPFEDDFKLEPVEAVGSLSGVDQDYVQYLTELYEVYINLGNYKYPATLGEIGLKSSNIEARKLQDQILYTAIDSSSETLELLINKQIDKVEDSEEMADKVQIYDLRDYLNVVNFIRAVYFSNDIMLTKNLSIWINKSDLNNPPIEVLDEIFRVEMCFTKDFFFKFLNQLLVRGLFDQALNVLLHSNYQQIEQEDPTIFNLFQCLVRLLNDYKQIFGGGSEEAEYIDIDGTDTFNVLFKNFKHSATVIVSQINEILAEAQDTVVLTYLKTTFALLAGSKSVILDQSNTWYEALNGLFLFQLPTIRLLNQYLTIVVNSGKFEVNYSNVWEVIAFNLIENSNFLLTLKSLESLNPDSVGYLAVLLEAKGFLRDYNKLDYLSGKGGDLSNILQDSFAGSGSENLSITEYLLYNHALSCFSNKKLVPVGISVLKSLDINNYNQLLTEFLPYGYPCDNNDESEWLISVCAENKLITLSNNLFKLFGLNFVQNGLILEGLENLNKAGDWKLIEKIIWEIFTTKLDSKYSSEQGVSTLDLFIDSNNLDQNIQLLDLTEAQKTELVTFKLNLVLRRFLAPYVMLFNYISSENAESYIDAKNYLIKLINFTYLPQRFQPVLLLFLLKYFYLNFETTNHAIGVSLFEVPELIAIIKVLNKYEKVSTTSQELYHKFLASNQIKIAQEFNEKVGIVIPKTIPGLLSTLRKKISLELARKYLE